MPHKQKTPFDPLESPTLKSWGKPMEGLEGNLESKGTIIDCGWGRLIFAHTFDDNRHIVDTLKDEQQGERDLAIYLKDPQVILSQAPQTLFLDPSHTFRLWLDKDIQLQSKPNNSITIKELSSKEDIEAINAIYQNRHMVPLKKNIIEKKPPALSYLMAVDKQSGNILGTMMGVDHVKAFNDPENGASLWALAVDPQAGYPGIGLELVEHFALFYKKQKRSFIDVSVLHSNNQAIALYEKIGFEKVPVFCVKKKNAINETLYTAPVTSNNFNPYADIIIREARKRGIDVEPIDEPSGFFKLKYGGKSIICRESLSELTSAIAMSRCAEKNITHALLKKHGLYVPNQILASNKQEALYFLERYKQIAVKPINGEQGAGISLSVTTQDELNYAVTKAGGVLDKVILEEFVQGEELRIIVINYAVVAAAIRKPPFIKGNNRHTVKELIEKLSRRRSNATDGESKVPMDEETERCIASYGYTMDDILKEGETLQVRHNANLHTGGTLHDCTKKLHPKLIEDAVKAAQVLEIPVVGLDLIIENIASPNYVIIEANERPGLANHEPQPVVEKFIDLLFPTSVTC